uniref:Chromosomal replication initiator protein DnaA n=1 Tax=Desulfovibrio sp. U5L TaxID=596152 RepID=I2PXA0_9BACT
MKTAPPNASGDGVLKEDFRQHLSRTCPEQDLRRWFDPLDLTVSESDQSFCVRFPHAYFAAWFETSVKELFEKQVSQFLGPGYAVRYQAPCRGNGHAPLPQLGAARVTDFPFGHRFTFETFLANEKNRFPLALAREVARGREVRYNPFLVCGPSGSGKTHLLRAMANAVARAQAGASVFFGSVGDLQNRYATSQSRHEVRSEVASHDWLFIDELTDIQRAPDLEQELIFLFNAFHDAGKQMVFSSRERTASCDFFDPTFKSRLEWGLMVHVKPPDLDVRIASVEAANRDKRLGLSREQVLTLASRFEGFRQLEGVLLRIEAFRRHAGQELTDAEFSRHIRLSVDKKAPELSPERILTVCAEHFGLTVAAIIGQSRRRELVFARQAAMALCRTLLGMSYPALGKVFGGKDHSTVLYSIRKFQQIQDDDRDTKILFRQLAKKCRQGGPA